MNTKAHRTSLYGGARIIAALFAGVLLAAKTPAQPPTHPVENRVLLIFDTSADMKKRLPATEAALNNLLATGMQNQLHTGDSIGVWTFDRELRAGQFPLQRWAPEYASAIAADLNRFIAKQYYSKTTRFAALQPRLNRVIQDSPRLTVLIFCDGEDEISWTPYNDDINRIFRQRRAEQKNAKQPFILLFRLQLGQYVGCTMNFPPGTVNFPEFPPFPLPPPVALTNAPPPPPPVEVPPLIVIGTKAGTNVPPPAPPAPAPAPPPETNPPPAPAPALLTNAVANARTNLPPAAAPLKSTNAPVVTPTHPVAPPAVVRTNAAAPLPKNSGLSNKKTLATGAALLVLAGALTILFFGRLRRTGHGSLITRSMNRGGKPPART